jgi:hypothetical protein
VPAARSRLHVSLAAAGRVFERKIVGVLPCAGMIVFARVRELLKS